MIWGILIGAICAVVGISYGLSDRAVYGSLRENLKVFLIVGLTLLAVFFASAAVFFLRLFFSGLFIFLASYLTFVLCSLLSRHFNRLLIGKQVLKLLEQQKRTPK